MSKAKLSLIKGNSSLHLNLEELYKEVAPKFAEIPESEKSYLLKHTICTVHYASQIAESMGLPPSEIKALETAALLHDIGKTEIPVNILIKKEPLTLREYWAIQAHPFFSEMLIKSLDVTEEVAAIIKKHHERIDGEGYPGGWKGDEICFSARILSVADSYAAMRSNTPYRKALSKKEAAEELKRGKSKQFDPVVVDEFIKILDKPKISFNAFLLLPLAKLRQLKVAVTHIEDSLQNVVSSIEPLQGAVVAAGVVLALSFGTGRTTTGNSNGGPKTKPPFEVAEMRLACEMTSMNKECSMKEETADIKALSGEIVEEPSLQENIEISASVEIPTGNPACFENKTPCEEIQTGEQIQNQTQAQNQHCESQNPDSCDQSTEEGKKSPPMCSDGNHESMTPNNNVAPEENTISEGNSASEGNCINSNNLGDDTQAGSGATTSDRHDSKH